MGATLYLFSVSVLTPSSFTSPYSDGIPLVHCVVLTLYSLHTGKKKSTVSELFVPWSKFPGERKNVNNSSQSLTCHPQSTQKGTPSIGGQRTEEAAVCGSQ